MTSIALYVRQSLDRSGDGLAVARQQEECAAWAKAKGRTTGAVYSDNDLSATTGIRRPGFEALLASGAKEVLVWHQDRLLRLPRDLERVMDAGLVVHSVQAGSLDLATAQGIAVARTVAAWSAYEGQQKSARQKASARQRANLGMSWWPVAPFGYAKDGTLTADADLVRAAYESVLGGVTLAEITRTWNAAGAVTPRGKPWIRTSVLAVLKSERNAGLRTYQGQVVGRGAWTAIVAEGTFQAVKAALADPKRGAGGGARKNLLTGVARCGMCGRGMVACTQGATGHRYKSYRCPSGELSVQANWLENLVVEVAKAPQEASRTSEGPRFRHYAQSPVVEALGTQADELRARQAEMSAAYAAGAIPMAVLVAGSADIEQRLAANLALAMIEAQRGPVYDTGLTWDAMTPAEQHAHLKATLEVRVGQVPRYTRRLATSVTIRPR